MVEIKLDQIIFNVGNILPCRTTWGSFNKMEIKKNINDFKKKKKMRCKVKNNFVPHLIYYSQFFFYFGASSFALCKSVSLWLRLKSLIINRQTNGILKVRIKLKFSIRNEISVKIFPISCK